MSVSNDVSREWHSRPINTATGIATLVALIFGIGVAAQGFQARVDLADRRLSIIEASMAGRIDKVASHDTQIEVLRTELRMMNTKLSSIDRKVDSLVDHDQAPRQ